MIDAPLPEPTTLVEARTVLTGAVKQVDARQSAFDQSREYLDRLQQPQPWLHRAWGYITGTNVRRAGEIRAAALKKSKALAALMEAKKAKLAADNRLRSATQLHRDTVRDHVAHWTAIAAGSEARLAAVARARELWQRLPGVATVGASNLFELASKFVRKSSPSAEDVVVPEFTARR